jgi:hypothetical protein
VHSPSVDVDQLGQRERRFEAGRQLGVDAQLAQAQVTSSPKITSFQRATVLK